MKPSGLLFVMADLQGGGAERVLITLANALVACGEQVTIFLFHHRIAYANTIDPRIRIITKFSDGHPVGLRAAQLLMAIASEAKQCRIVIGGLEGWPDTMAWLAARISGRPVISWVHTDVTKHFYKLPRFLRWLQRLTFRQVDRVVCISAGVQQELERFIGGQRQNQIVITNLIPPVTAKDAIRCMVESPLVLAAGRLQIDQKGFDLLIRAHAQLRRDGILHRLVILGEGRDRHLLEALVATEDVGDSVSLPGFAQDMNPWYAQATLFALSSRQEGLSMVLLEAMQRGIPVVATNCNCGPAELLDGGYAGELVDPESVPALVHGLRRLLTDPTYRDKLAARGQRRAQDFAVDRILPEWLTLFSSLAPE